MLYVASSFLETESSGLSKDEYLSVNVSVEIVTCVDNDVKWHIFSAIVNSKAKRRNSIRRTTIKF